MTRLVRGSIGVGMLLLLAGCGHSPAAPSGTPIIYDVGSPGVSAPTVARQVNPSYTPEALRNHVVGSVRLSAVVLADGTVGDVAVVQSLDTVYGLDAQAVFAAKQWTFNPGTKDGEAVAVRVTIEMTFSIA